MLASLETVRRICAGSRVVQLPRLLMVATVHTTLRAFLIPIANHFRSQGWQVDAMASGVTTDQDCQQAFDGLWEARWSRNPLNPFNLIGTTSRIRQIASDGRYDIVHVHTPVASFVTRFALRRLSKPKVICTVHGFHFHRNGNPFMNFLFQTIEKMAGRWTDRLVVINNDDYKAALHNRIVGPKNLMLMPGIGVDPGFYASNRISEEETASLRRELEIQEGAPLFLMIAEFSRNKRQADLLKALALLKEDSSAHLVFAGTGVLEEKVRQLVENMGLSNRTRFLGYRRDIRVLLSSSTALVLASAREGLPRSVMEAMSMQVPVIGADARGTRDLLENKCGLIYPVGDVHALAGAMKWVVDHKEEAYAMGLRGRAVIQTEYSLTNVLRLHEELYRDVLAEIGAVC